MSLFLRSNTPTVVSKAQVRIVRFPPCPFEDFLTHMNESSSPEWVWSYMEMCARFGVLHSSQDACLLARPVNSAIPEADIQAFNDLDPNHPLASSGLTDQHDTWHILYASGNPTDFFDLCPYELPKLSWYRMGGDSELKTYDFHRIKSRYHGK